MTSSAEEALKAELDALQGRIWAELQTAIGQRGHAWRTATLATVTHEGLPDARNVVLREADPMAASLTFYTDLRSPKVSQMRLQPRGVLVVWSPALSWQLRLQVQLQVEPSGPAVASRWAELCDRPGAQDYLAPLPPGTPLNAAGVIPKQDAASHFAVVRAQVLAMDWLHLQAAGHRRAWFQRGQEPCWLQA